MKEIQVFHYLSEHLKQVLPFTEAETTAISRKMFRKVYSKGERFITEGEINTSSGFICNGLMRLFYIKEEKEFTVKFFYKNSWIGNLQSIHHGEPSQYYLEAVIKTEMLVFDSSAMNQLFNEVPRFERYIRLMIDSAFRQLIREKADRILLSPEEQYLQLLDRHAALIEVVPLKQIASFLNIEPGSLSRIRNRIAKSNKKA
ncbi:MAG: Crp/Fnr family transcriptional regulator [Taibaiella sp.]|nr:Crp/Fnr family transcriptional regulator [Taibaiella sp.]